MNRHTFLDVINDKRSSLLNDVAIDDDDDEDDDDDMNFNKLQEDIEGEEDHEGDISNAYNDIGEVMEPFNMRNERESGHIDKNMNYVYDNNKNTENENGEQDSWLADLDNEVNMEKAIGEALNAKEKIKTKQQQLKQQKEKELRNFKKFECKEDVKLELLYILKRGETVSDAMRRLSSGSSSSTESKEKEEENKSKLNELMGLVNVLSSGSASEFINIGNESRWKEMKEEEDIFTQSYDTIQDAVIRWEYQAPNGSIQGPFTWNMMASWLSMGYFQGSTTVLTRQVYPHRKRNQSSNLQNNSNSDGNSKKRKNVDDASDITAAHSDNINTKRKRVEFSTYTNVSSHNTNADLNDELLADFDDDDDDDDAKTGSSSNNSNLGSTSTSSLLSDTVSATSALPVHGPWIRSDSLLGLLSE